MKIKFIEMFFVLFILATLFACATSFSTQHATGDDISLRDAKKIHPRSHLTKRIRDMPLRLDPLAEGKVAYYEARRRKGIYGQDGNIFLFHAEGESGPMRILVCVLNRRAHEVVVEGEPRISNEFLSQFIDRSLENSLEIAKDPSDLLTVPGPIRPEAQAPKSSQAIANAVKMALMFGRILGL
ncbi:MAG TPA: hypothetical protein VI382_06150 [Candidatus Manganitrophaceae bacterium]|nr:hypothetical protein [Candidatus Manganitrophaceae bacterium]